MFGFEEIVRLLQQYTSLTTIWLTHANSGHWQIHAHVSLKAQLQVRTTDILLTEHRSSLVEILCLRPNVAIAYLYLEKTHEIVSARNLLACILKQLTEHTGRIAHAILESYGRDPSRKTQPREIQLLDMLVEQARGSERVYIFVDALDRMESRLVFQLLTALNNFQDRAKNVSIIVSSPEISEYRQKLDRAREHEVCANEEEMALFVHHHIERSEDSIMYTMTREDKALESQIQAIVREKAGGM